MNRDFEDLGGRDPHDVLGVPVGAGAAEISRTFRRRLRETHPDVGGSHKQQVALNLARDILLDPDRLECFQERTRHVRQQPAEAPPYEDPFEWETGAGPAPPFDVPPLRPEVIVEPTLDDVFPPHAWSSGPGPGNPGWYPPAPTRYPPPRPVTPQPWSVLAFVALGLSACFPVGLIVGLVALNRIHRRRQRGNAVAWVAIGIQILVFTVALAMGLVGGPHPDPAPTPHSSSAHSKKTPGTTAPAQRRSPSARPTVQSR